MTDATPEVSGGDVASAGASATVGAGARERDTATAAFNVALSNITKRSDIALALGIVCILVVLLLPMPTWMLYFSLAVSITFSVLILRHTSPTVRHCANNTSASRR